ncbi:hypothetical protein L484_021437 [Morus notabilis]|uniref:Uncharacterized protein n=1 Tax=Morus notabilis TaxID=981085 RepID=W9RPD5_9ROSA|nr:hypothetical protein L484_021437 [Morus notabilis]
MTQYFQDGVLVSEIDPQNAEQDVNQNHNPDRATEGPTKNNREEVTIFSTQSSQQGRERLRRFVIISCTSSLLQLQTPPWDSNVSPQGPFSGYGPSCSRLTLDACALRRRSYCRTCHLTRHMELTDDPILREVDDYAAEAGIDSVDALVDGNESGEGSLVGGEMRGFTAAFVDAPLAGMSGDPDRPIFTADVTVLRIQSRDIVRAYKDGCIDRRWFDYFLPDANFRSKCDG